MEIRLPLRPLEVAQLEGLTFEVILRKNYGPSFMHDWIARTIANIPSHSSVREIRFDMEAEIATHYVDCVKFWKKIDEALVGDNLAPERVTFRFLDPNGKKDLEDRQEEIDKWLWETCLPKTWQKYGRTDPPKTRMEFKREKLPRLV